MDLHSWDIPDDKYKNGKIYIVKDVLNEKFSYIGSTHRELDVRLKEHKYKKASSFCFLFSYVRKNYLNNWDNMYIELLFDYPCNTNRELRYKEYETIINKKPFNTLTKIELYIYKPNADTLFKPNQKDIIKYHQHILEEMDYNADNEIRCPFCLKYLKFYNIYYHVHSKYHNEICGFKK